MGKIWSCYWNDYKATPKLKEPVITSTKPTLCNASATSVKNASSECISSSISDINHSKGIDNIHNSTNVVETKIGDIQMLNDKESDILSHNNSTDQYNITNNSCEEASTIGLNLNDSNLQLVNNSTKNIKIENEFINSLNIHVKEEKDIYAQNTQIMNNVRGIPKITSIEKTNIDISNVIIGNQHSIHQDLNKKVLSINKPPDGTGDKTLSLTNGKLFSNDLLESEKLVTLEPFENNELNNEVAITKSNLSVTMMEIDGLPPITLSFEIPVSTTIPETVTSSLRHTDYKNNTTGSIVNIKSNTLEMKSTPLKRNVTSGKQYEKFSFTAIKKKMEPNNSINSNSINFLNMKSNPKIQGIENDLTNCTKNGNSNESISNQSNNSVTVTNIPSQENITSSVVNTSLNIDTVLEDFLSSDYSVSEDINDEWINSLLS